MAEQTYRARYWRHHTQDEYECGSLDEAVAFLAWGWEADRLAEIDVIGPDGSVVLEGSGLFDRMMELIS